ncbi:MAG: 50S ribosomal protein L10 [Acidobacteriota bacterium]
MIVLDFKGISVPDITELREKVRQADGRYTVVKNTLALRAAEGTVAAGLQDCFRGPTAVAVTGGDTVALAKVLKDFVKNNQGMSFKAGVLEGRVITQAQVENLADLPSREELLSKLLFLLNAPLSRLASALSSPVRNLAVVLSEVAKKQQ